MAFKVEISKQQAIQIAGSKETLDALKKAIERFPPRPTLPLKTLSRNGVELHQGHLGNRGKYFLVDKEQDDEVRIQKILTSLEKVEK
jgi:hypothetical protein